MHGAWVMLGIASLAAVEPSWAAARLASGRTTPRVALVRSSKSQPIEVAARALAEALQGQQPRIEVASYLLPGRTQIADMLDQIRQARPDLVLTLGSRATAAAVDQPWDVPLLFSMVLYPEQAGFVRAGVTGISLDVSPDEQFRLLRRLLPRARVVGVLYDPDETGRVVTQARRSAERLGFRFEEQQVSGPPEVLRVVDRLMRRVDVLWAVADANVFTPLTTGPIQLAALRRGVPVMGLSASHARTGALAAFMVDYAAVGRQTAALVRRVLGGQAPVAIPVAPARKVGVIVNARTARRLGLVLDATVTKQATEVVR